MKKINLYENMTKSLIEKQLYYKSRIGDWSESMIFSSYDSYILYQVNVYWPLIGEGIRPNLISLDGSLAILKKIIDERRVFDAYFNTINARSISIARMTYKIMDMAVKNQIPIDAMAKRLSRFKRGRKIGQTYNDLNNLIVEYRSILNKNKLYDRIKIYESFVSLLEDKNYPKDLKEVGIELIKSNSISSKLYVARPSISKKIDSIDILKENSVLASMSEIDDFSEDRKEIRYSLLDDYTSYDDMKKALRNLLYKMVDEDGISCSDIGVVVANLNEDILAMVDDMSLEFSIRTISRPERFSANRETEAVLAALAVYKDCEYLLPDEEKVELLKLFYRDKNYIDLKKNMQVYMREFRDGIRKSMSPVFDLDSVDDGADGSLIDIGKIEESISREEFDYEYTISDAEFIKKFYKIYVNFTEESIMLISKMADLVEEIGDLMGDEYKYSYIKEVISYHSSSKVKLENMAMQSILVVSKEDIKTINIGRKHLIIFDANSKKYDPVLEDSIYTQIAFLDDSILSNITEENINILYRELLEDEIDRDVDNIVSNYSNIYIMASDKGINGYEQENIFYKRFVDRLEEN